MPGRKLGVRDGVDRAPDGWLFSFCQVLPQAVEFLKSLHGSQIVDGHSPDLIQHGIFGKLKQRSLLAFLCAGFALGNLGFTIGLHENRRMNSTCRIVG